MSSHASRSVRLATLVAATAGGIVATGAPAVASTPAVTAQRSCPGVIQTSAFTTEKQLRRLTTEFNSYGPRILGSKAHDQAIDFLRDEAREIDGVKVHTDPFRVYRWLPRTRLSAVPDSTSAPPAGSP